MDAGPLLRSVARALVACKLEAILIGNAAAALHGAPVTTLDFDFMFRSTPANRTKLKKLAKELDATVFRPYYPVSGLFRILNETGSLQLDFLPAIAGIKSFASLRSRATEMEIGTSRLLVADLGDIIKSKRTAGRPKDKAVLPVLEVTHEQAKKNKA